MPINYFGRPLVANALFGLNDMPTEQLLESVMPPPPPASPAGGGELFRPEVAARFNPPVNRATYPVHTLPLDPSQAILAGTSMMLSGAPAAALSSRRQLAQTAASPRISPQEDYAAAMLQSAAMREQGRQRELTQQQRQFAAQEQLTRDLNAANAILQQSGVGAALGGLAGPIGAAAGGPGISEALRLIQGGTVPAAPSSVPPEIPPTKPEPRNLVEKVEQTEAASVARLAREKFERKVKRAVSTQPGVGIGGAIALAPQNKLAGLLAELERSTVSEPVALEVVKNEIERHPDLISYLKNEERDISSKGIETTPGAARFIDAIGRGYVRSLRSKSHSRQRETVRGISPPLEPSLLGQVGSLIDSAAGGIGASLQPYVTARRGGGGQAYLTRAFEDLAQDIAGTREGLTNYLYEILKEDIGRTRADLEAYRQRRGL